MPEDDIVLARYYDPATGQFLTVDPDVAMTLAPYGYVGGDPVNAYDPSGECVWIGCWVANQLGYTVKGAQAAGGAISSALPTCVRDPFGGNNNNGGCQTTLSTSQGVTGIGIALGAASIITGVGAFAGADALGGSSALGLISVGSGSGAGFLDLGPCLQGNKAACVGADLGLSGAVAAAPELLGGLFGVAEGSTLAGALTASSFFGLFLGLSGTFLDLTTGLLACPGG